MKVTDLVNEYSRAGAFNAGRLAEACKLYCHMLDDNATVGLTLSGAMTPTGMGGILISLIENGFVDFHHFNWGESLSRSSFCIEFTYTPRGFQSRRFRAL